MIRLRHPTAALLALLIWGWGLYCLLWFGERVTLQCQQLQGVPLECTLTRTTLRGADHRQLPLGEPTAARVQRSVDSDGDTRYQVRLVMARGEIPLLKAPSYGNGGRQVDQAATINQFLAHGSGRELVLEDDNRAGIGFLSLMLLVTGGVLGYVAWVD